MFRVLGIYNFGHNHCEELHQQHTCKGGIFQFCTSASSKNQSALTANGQAFRSAKVRKSARKFAHGLY